MTLLASAIAFPFTPTPVPSVTTPAAVASYINEVDGEIRTLNDDIVRQVKSGAVTLPVGWGEARNQFVLDWSTFTTSYLGGGYLVILPGDAWTQVAVFQTKNEDWAAKFLALGGKRTGPAPTPPPMNDLGSVVKWAAAALVAVAVAVVVYEVRK